MDLELTSNWAVLDDKEKAHWLQQFVLHATPTTDVLDANLVHLCAERLDTLKKKLFVSNMMSEVAAYTYEGKTPEQIASVEMREKFYYNCVFINVERIGKCIYWAARGEEV